MHRFHLAQFNLARAIAPLDSPPLADFVGAIERINAVAESAPGFVWRLVGPADDAPAAIDAHDKRLLLNMSVWESPEALFAYVYKSAHTQVMVKRRQWFERPSAPHQVLWWIPAGHRPTLDEGRARLEHLRQNGPTPFAFTFKARYPAPDLDGEPTDMNAERYCEGWS